MCLILTTGKNSANKIQTSSTLHDSILNSVNNVCKILEEWGKIKILNLIKESLILIIDDKRKYLSIVNTIFGLIHNIMGAKAY